MYDPIEEAIQKLQQLMGNKKDGTFDPEIRISGLTFKPDGATLNLKAYVNNKYPPLTPQTMNYLARALDILSIPLISKAIQIAEADQLARYKEEDRMSELGKTINRRPLRCS